MAVAKRCFFRETLVSESINAIPHECVRASTGPNGKENLTLRKCNCLNVVSFAFLVKVSLERGNLTAVKPEAAARAFRFLFAEKKDETR